MLIPALLYTHFTLPNQSVSLDLLILGICIGVGIGSVAATVDKVLCERAIRELVRREAQTGERALSIRQLEMKGKWYLRLALREGKPLRKLLTAVMPADTDDTAPKLADIPFYPPEENRIRAESRWETGRHPIMTLILCLILLAAGGLFLRFIIPELLTMTDNMLGTL